MPEIPDPLVETWISGGEEIILSVAREPEETPEHHKQRFEELVVYWQQPERFPPDPE